ncbi:hypothetical protein IQ268_11160 [Oculatella sp. LEGE 06141]|uniref:hypothetical protein n=1 Tax=Oculatella sp. LEGE 06141 TaxID=1828648 RepID=UPI001880E991|nr:hypothetical protein [Oculatella sp. LEGE 06141]MBE9179120.1 hypothetical protein [Oculatella sp. LEGE 06141]
MTFFKRRINAGLGADVPNDCDLQAQQQQRIQESGHRNPKPDPGDGSSNQDWYSEDDNGDWQKVDKSVYRSLCLVGAIALSGLITGCPESYYTYTAPAQASGSHAPFGSWTEPPLNAQSYGGLGELNPEEINAILHLAFPQQYESIKDRFGLPNKRDEHKDYYRIGGTTRWLAIEYQGKTATSYTLSN